jgi:hypothetical protein
MHQKKIAGKIASITSLHPRLIPECVQAWHDLTLKAVLSEFSTSTVSYRNVFLCFLSGSVELMTSTQKKMLRYVTIEVENTTLYRQTYRSSTEATER